jgi:hypothetical protein
VEKLAEPFHFPVDRWRIPLGLSSLMCSSVVRARLFKRGGLGGLLFVACFASSHAH